LIAINFESETLTLFKRQLTNINKSFKIHSEGAIVKTQLIIFD